MFSNDSARQADACRFCWMCRHICPVAGATGNEAWTPRARGLMISMIERESVEYEETIAEAMFHCTLCDACANDCATSYKPSVFIREARTHAHVNGIAPKKVCDAVDAVLNTGSIFGADKADEIFSAVGELPDEADILLFLGQTARAAYTQAGVNACSLLKKAGINFTALKNEPASGAYLGEMMGFTGDVQAVAAKTAEMIAATGAKKLVVLNPADAVMFRDQYSFWGLLGGVEVVTFTAFAAELLASGALNPAGNKLKSAIQEPVKLTRSLDEIAPFKAVAKAAGVELTEMFLNGKMSRCIGTVPFDMYDSTVVKGMVKVRCDDASRLGVNTIITASPDDYYIMSKYKTEDVEIADIFAILDSIC